MSDPLHIRLLGRADLPALLELYPHLHTNDDPLPPMAEVEAVWTELLGSERNPYFGGFSGGRLVASCNLTVVPNLTRGCRPYALVENVVTHADFRGRGHGKAVLAAALAHAWASGCYKAMLMTSRQDAATHAFYRAAGFDGDAKRAFVAVPPASP